MIHSLLKMPKIKTIKRWNTLWCCNPLGLEKHTNKVGKRKVTEEMCKKIPNLVVGDAICHVCRLKVSKMNMSVPDENTDTEGETEKTKTTSEEEYLPTNKESEASISNVNKLLTPTGQSPISIVKLSRSKSYAQR